MGSDSPAPASRSLEPVRAWPAALLVVLYWIFQLAISQAEMGMFARFLSNALSAAAFLLLFIILWMANGTVAWRLRFLGLALLLAGAGVGILLAHSSFQPVGFLMMSVPYVLTGWTLWMFAMAGRQPRVRAATLTVLVLAGIGVFDLIRWDGLDGRLRSSVSARWAATPEQALLASKSASASVGRVTKPWTPRAGDWPEFRGPLRDGVVRGVRIESNWKDSPPQKIWSEDVGPGWSSMIVVDGYLVTQEQRGESEAVVCYEAKTGKEVWRHEDAARFSEGIAGPGPRATPTYHDGRIYTQGGGGLLLCLEASSGRPVWSRTLLSDASGRAPQWGCSASPLIADGRVIVFVGGEGARGAVALDAATGAPVWSTLGGKESYSSAHLVRFRGTAQVLMQDNKRLVGLSIRDGSVLWERPGVSESAIPMLQPLVLGDGKFLITSGPGIALFEVRGNEGAWTVSESWTTERFRPSFSDFVVHDGHVYGLDDGVLACVDLKTGGRIWRKGRYGSGQVLLLEDSGLLVVLSEKGELALVNARPQEPGDVFRFPAIVGKTWNHPVIVQDRLFVRNGTQMACYQLRAAKTP